MGKVRQGEEITARSFRYCYSTGIAHKIWNDFHFTSLHFTSQPINTLHGTPWFTRLHCTTLHFNLLHYTLYLYKLYIPIFTSIHQLNTFLNLFLNAFCLQRRVHKFSACNRFQSDGLVHKEKFPDIRSLPPVPDFPFIIIHAQIDGPL